MYTAPMQEIMRYLKNKGYLVYWLDDAYRENTPIEEWPRADVLISFFSNGMDFLKMQKYARMCRPLEVNKIDKQFLLTDRRAVLAVLDRINVPTEKRLIYNSCSKERESIYAPRGVPEEGDPVCETIKEELKKMNICADSIMKKTGERKCNGDILVIDGKTINKPYVEKPIYSENHNISIYYSSKCGKRSMGICRLFRKIGHKSSEFIPNAGNQCSYQNDGYSYIYEKYLKMQNYLDIKAYALGKKVYAETRKSPVKDGIVIRNELGKEKRMTVQLTDKEIRAVQRISKSFGQLICGMDILRTENSEFVVIDVNGWSFVKTNPMYYRHSNLKELDKYIKRNVLCSRAKKGDIYRKHDLSFIKNSFSEYGINSDKEVIGVHTVYRHGSRTPKTKKKFTFSSAPLFQYAEGIMHSAGRDTTRIKKVQEILYSTIAGKKYGNNKNNNKNNNDNDKNQNTLNMMSKIISKNKNIRVKLLPIEGEKVKVILKWGGVLTSSSHKEIEYEAIEYELYLSSLIGSSPFLGEPGQPKREKESKTTKRKVKIMANSEERTFQTGLGFLSMLQWSQRAEEQIEEKNLILPDVSYSDSVQESVSEEIQAAYIHLRDNFAECKRKHNSIIGNTPEIFTEPPTDTENKCKCNSSFFDRWSFLFSEYPELSTETALTAIPILLDFANYDSLHHFQCSNCKATQFFSCIVGIYHLFYAYAQKASARKLKYMLKNKAEPEIARFVHSLFNGETDTIFVTKRFNILLLLRYIMCVAEKKECKMNMQLKEEIEKNIHNIGFLCSISFVHITDKKTHRNSNSKEYLLVYYSPGTIPYFPPNEKPLFLRTQRKRPLMLIEKKLLFSN